MKATDGAIYGPVSRAELDEWYRDGRIAAESELQQQGATGWVKAISVYPSLGNTRSPAATTSPFARGATPHPVAARTHPVSVARPAFVGAPHRAGMILAFGIISWVTCMSFCVFINLGFGIAAWVMGRADLAAMREGRMDPSGQPSTQAGMILGMVNVIDFCSAAALYVMLFVTGAIAEGM